MNPDNALMQNQESPQDILKSFEARGISLDKKFESDIQETRDYVFKYLNVATPEELKAKLANPQELPIGFVVDAYFAGDEVKIGSQPNGVNAHCVLVKPEYARDLVDPLDRKGLPQNIQDAINSFVYQESEKDYVTGLCWKSDGIQKSYYKSDLSHKGIWIAEGDREKGLGHGLYRLHESIFGETSSEEASSLSLLRQYIQLGFAPKCLTNPLSGEKLVNMNVEDALQDYFKTGKETLDFSVFLERK